MSALIISLVSLAICAAAYLSIRRQRVVLERALMEPPKAVETSTSIRTVGEEAFEAESVVVRSGSPSVNER